MRKPTTLLIILSIFAPLSIGLALSIGNVAISPGDIIAALSGDSSSTNSRIIYDLRIPRTIGAFTCGGLLSIAGVLMQVLLRNPLADPYILGISGGAAVMTLLAMLAGLSGTLLTGSAFAGALISMFIVFGLAHGKGSWTPTRLLLTGVVIAAGWGAMISFILAVTPDRNIHSMLFWLMGDLSYVESVLPPLMVLILGAGLSLLVSGKLNVLLHGDLQADSLGIDVGRLRLVIFIIASLLTASAVTMAGTIGFVGLVVPHFIRLLGINNHKFLLPSAMLLGGTLLVLADIFARIIIAPHQLPVGVLTALIGVPFFLLLLHKSNQPV